MHFLWTHAVSLYDEDKYMPVASSPDASPGTSAGSSIMISRLKVHPAAT